MEGDGITTVGSSPPPADIEILSVGSPEDLGFHEEEAALPSSAAPPSSSPEATDVLTDDLKEKIIRQVEYYFSDENLPTDKFLMKHVNKDKEGFVPVAIIGSFRKMKKLVQNKSLVVAALRESSQLILSSDGKKVRRIRPLPITEIMDAKSCTVVVENLPDDCSTENLQKIFGDVGNIKNICIRDPHATDDSTKASKAEMAISGKLHALVEYETLKEAEKAVDTLNDVKSWRNGMRVELLLKRMDKYGLAKKGWKGMVSEKKVNVPASHMVGNEKNVKSLDHHDETPEQEESNHSSSEKVGRSRRSQGRGRGRGQGQGQGQGQSQFRGHKQHSVNGRGHGYAPTGSRSEGLSKPPPGPRMPDGTRGFTLGRGQTLPCNHNQE